MTETNRCRWGILSTAGIARKNWRAIVRSQSGAITAVASRRLESAQSFINECQANTPQANAPEALSSYQALLERKDVDAVYIPLPTGLRKEWIIAAAKHGKHVLAEKPAALSATDLEEILDVCRQNGVQFMDGVMFMHSARLPLLRQILDDKTSIGQIRRIACNFSFLGDNEFGQSNIRVDSQLEPFGCLGDLGWYCIRMMLWANAWQMPTKAIGRCLQQAKGLKSDDAVPSEFSAELWFPNGSTASFYCSFLTGHQQWFHVSGTRGNVLLSDFVLPYFGSEVAFEVQQPHFSLNVCDFHMQEHTKRYAVDEYASSYAPAQEINMIECMNRIALSKQINPMWGDICLATQKVMDDLMQSAESC